MTVPEWRLVGDWFDICSCDIACPCEFAQAPTGNVCHGLLAWHVREGSYGDVRLDGFTLVALGMFEGNIWAGEAKVTMGLFIDETADERQREALQVIFGLSLKRACWRLRAPMTRSRICVDISPVRSLVISRNFTGGTSMCRSILSSSGPETRPR